MRRIIIERHSASLDSMRKTPEQSSFFSAATAGPSTTNLLAAQPRPRIRNLDRTSFRKRESIPIPKAFLWSRSQLGQALHAKEKGCRFAATLIPLHRGVSVSYSISHRI